ncbi:MAG: hypothetical protein WCP41_00125 [Verrucomicrobiota bacterium]
MIRSVLYLLLGTIMVPSLSAISTESWESSLTDHQKEDLLSGKQVMIEVDIPGKPWPCFTIHKLVDATPEDVAAVFWNCELAPAYVPNCISVKIISRPSPGIIEAEYTLKMPFFLPNEIYLSRNELTSPTTGSYKISWHVDQSRYIRKSIGNILLQPARNGTLISYTNFVEPSSKFSRLLRSKAGEEVMASVGALKRQIMNESHQPSPLLLKQVEDLRLSLQVPPPKRPIQ